MGDIGIPIAQKCEAALVMSIAYQGPRRKADAETKLKGDDRYYSDLLEMLSVVDCVVVTASYSPSTHHLFSQRGFRVAKKTGLRVVNIARGKIIDEDALGSAL